MVYIASRTGRGTGATLLTMCVSVLTATAGDMPAFTEEAHARGVDYTVVQGDWGEQFGCGIAFCDLDRDGDPDLVVLGRVDGVVGIYENDGTGVFTSRTVSSGVAAQTMPSGVVAADYDRDGDLDLYISNWLAPNALLRNDGNFQFTDVASAAGVDHAGPGVGCAWGDYDGDGWLDLFVTGRNWPPLNGANVLYRNLGDGTFHDVAAALGVDAPNEATFQPVFFDFDRDGDADLYLSTDKAIGCGKGSNHLFENLGGTFREITETSGTAACIDSMGVAVGDFDGNGLPDLYCTNIPQGNPLFLNQGDGVFHESSDDAGVASYVTGWGAWFFDADHDADLDLYICNVLVANRLYLGGAWPCPDVAADLGVADEGESFCMAVADIDDDGDLDFAVENRLGAIKLYISHAAELDRRWVKIRLSGQGPVADPIGAVVRVRTGETWQTRELFAGSSYKSQNELVLHFGLGAAAVIDEIEITWPGGLTRTLVGLDADRTWWLDPPGEGGDANGDGVVDFSDLLTVLSSWGPCVGCVADLDDNGTIDFADLLLLLSSWTL